MSDVVIVETMKHHHASLWGGLQTHVDLLADNVAAAQDHLPAQRAIQAFLAGEIYPHALAEEQVLYPLAWRQQDLRELVDAMIAEHRWLQAASQTLTDAPDAVRAVAAAQAISSVFRLHAQKENRHILPALAVDPAINLEAALAQMHAAFEAAQAGNWTTVALTLTTAGEHQAADPALAEDGVLDVRPLPPRRRHELIFSTFKALAPGQHFELINDHDPKPLRSQLTAEHPDTFSWDYLEAGPSTWRVRISRTAA